MRVLHINNLDLTGQRFNGYNLIDNMNDYGFECSQMVLRKESNNRKVHELLSKNPEKDLQTFLEQYENEHSLCKIIYPWAEKIIASQEFADADIIHLHLVHNNLISILDLNLIASLKPTVWTWHDPWPLTGHCIHPMNCTKWKTGCQTCPHLDYTFPLFEDTSKEHWKAKHETAKKSNISIIVASKFLEDMCKESPIAQEFSNIYRIPFGLDLSFKKTVRPASETKSALGIPQANTVIFFRCDNVGFKGAEYIIEALREIDFSECISILTVGNKTLPPDILAKFHCIQLPWQNSENSYYSLLNSADFLLMPSTAETFGLMAIEAMALAKPVVAFRKTALEEIVSHGKDGLLADYKNSHDLAEAINTLVSDPAETQRMGLRGLEKISTLYSFNTYKKSLAKCYEETLDIWHSTRKNSPKKVSVKSLVAKSGNLHQSFNDINNLLSEEDPVREIKKLVGSNFIKKPIIILLKKMNLIRLAVRIKSLFNPQRKKMKHVAIISYMFPPMSSIGAMRPLRIAMSLEDKYNCAVFAATPEKDGERKGGNSSSLNLLRKTKIMRNNDKLSPPIFSKSRLAFRLQAKIKSKMPLTPLEKRLNEYLEKYQIPTGKINQIWVSRTLKAMLSQHKVHPFSLIVSTTPPFNNIVVARIFSDLTGVPYVLDYRDLFSGNPFLHPTEGETALEKDIICQASEIVAVTAGFQKTLESFSQREVSLIHNGFLSSQKAPANNTQTINIMYAGIMYDTDFSKTLFASISATKGNNVSFNFYGILIVPEEYLPSGTTHFHHHGYISKDEIIPIEKNADALIIISIPNRPDVIPAKTFDALSYEKPVIYIGNKMDEAFQILESAGLIIGCGSTIKELVSIFDGLTPDKLKISPDNAEIEKYSYKNQSKQFLTLIENNIIDQRRD